MTAEEIRALSGDEVKDKEAALRESVFRLKFKLSLGETDAVRTYREAKKDLARLLTIRRERDRAAAAAGGMIDRGEQT
ncbi:MAG: 50S ribosomal protein L29 [Acidobacteria bacterium]|nr:50S ribosomal protein L29 [Acidobacteriota bacterium]